MTPANKTVEIYYLVDEFLKEYDAVIKSHSLEKGTPKKRKHRKFTMSGSEVMTILILFHSSSFRDLKHFYLFVRTYMKKDFHKRIFGELFGDRGYISKDLFEQLFIDGVHLITRLKKGMKNALMLQHEKIMLRKRSLIETVNDQLKNICQIEHTRHRCFPNFIINLLSALAAFSFFDKKPSINTAEEFVHPCFLGVIGRLGVSNAVLGVSTCPYRWWHAALHRLQKPGSTRVRTVKISNRPTIIRKERIHLLKEEMAEKLPSAK